MTIEQYKGFFEGFVLAKGSNLTPEDIQVLKNKLDEVWLIHTYPTPISPSWPTSPTVAPWPWGTLTSDGTGVEIK